MGQWRFVALFAALWVGTACTGLKDDSSSGESDSAVLGEDASTPKGERDSGTRGGRGGSSGGEGGSGGRGGAGGADAGGSGGDASTAGTGGSAPPDGGPPPCEQVRYYADSDRDGYGNPAVSIEACEPPDGHVANDQDCDDDCKPCHPGGTEVCDGVKDENCSGASDEGCACTSGLTRACGEERGVCEPGTQSCTAGAWSTSCEGATGPTGAETCNELDDDCDGKIDESAPGSCCDDAQCAATHRCDTTRTCVPKTWCQLRARPNDVTAGDYQCLDFDASTSLPGSPWAATNTGGGMLNVTTAEASSTPHSLYSHAHGEFADKMYIEWSAAAGTTARSVTFAADIRPRLVEGLYVPWGDCAGEDPNMPGCNAVAEVFCVSGGVRKHCLGYNVGFHTQGIGMVLISKESNANPELFCDIVPTLTEAIWSRVELTVSTTGAPVVKVNGTVRTTTACTMTLSSAATSVRSQVGFSNDFDGEGWSAHIDNVEIMVRR